MSAEFTPGPWRYGYKDGSGRCASNVYEESGGYIFSQSRSKTTRQPVVRGGCLEGHIPYGVLKEADAYLIAAAPEMYALLVEARGLFPARYYDFKTRIDAVLAKARGEQP